MQTTTLSTAVPATVSLSLHVLCYQECLLHRGESRLRRTGHTCWSRSCEEPFLSPDACRIMQLPELVTDADGALEAHLFTGTRCVQPPGAVSAAHPPPHVRVDQATIEVNQFSAPRRQPMERRRSVAHDWWPTVRQETSSVVGSGPDRGRDTRRSNRWGRTRHDLHMAFRYGHCPTLRSPDRRSNPNTGPSRTAGWNSGTAGGWDAKGDGRACVVAETC